MTSERMYCFERELGTPTNGRIVVLNIGRDAANPDDTAPTTHVISVQLRAQRSDGVELLLEPQLWRFNKS